MDTKTGKSFDVDKGGVVDARCKTSNVGPWATAVYAVIARPAMAQYSGPPDRANAPFSEIETVDHTIRGAHIQYKLPPT